MQSSAKAQTMSNATHVAWCFLLITAIGPLLVHGDPDPMARPTRPKVITSPEELRRYLDSVKDYYTLNGKARYGKRGGYSSPLPNLDHLWDVLRTLAKAQEQLRQQKHDIDEDNDQNLEVSDFMERPLKTRPEHLPKMLMMNNYDDIQ